MCARSSASSDSDSTFWVQFLRLRNAWRLPATEQFCRRAFLRPALLGPAARCHLHSSATQLRAACGGPALVFSYLPEGGRDPGSLDTLHSFLHRRYAASPCCHLPQPAGCLPDHSGCQHMVAWRCSGQGAAPAPVCCDHRCATFRRCTIGAHSVCGCSCAPEEPAHAARPHSSLERQHKVPVMVHVESTRMADLEQLLQRFPDVPVIWAHGGYTPLFLARRMLDRYPNLYYELSARTWALHPRSPDYTILRDGVRVWPEWLALIESMPARFMVGTDASHRSAASDEMKYASVQSFLAQLKPGAREQVASGTLLRLVGIDPVVAAPLQRPASTP